MAQLLTAGQKGREGPLSLPHGFFDAPSHHAARMLRDIYADDAVATTMEVRGCRRGGKPALGMICAGCSSATCVAVASGSYADAPNQTRCGST